MALSEEGLVTALWIIGIYAGVLTVGIAIVAAVVFMVSRSRNGEGRITFKLYGTLEKAFYVHNSQVLRGAVGKEKNLRRGQRLFTFGTGLMGCGSCSMIAPCRSSAFLSKYKIVTKHRSIGY